MALSMPLLYILLYTKLIFLDVNVCKYFVSLIKPGLVLFFLIIKLVEGIVEKHNISHREGAMSIKQ